MPSYRSSENGPTKEEAIAAYESDQQTGTKNALKALQQKYSGGGGGDQFNTGGGYNRLLDSPLNPALASTAQTPFNPPPGFVDPGFAMAVPNAANVDPGFAVATPNAANVDPGFATGLAGIEEQLTQPGAYDYLNENAQAPDPRLHRRLGELEQTRSLGLDAALEDQAQQYQPGVVDKIAKYGGLAALIAGMAGLGNRQTEKKLKQFGGLGLGFASGRQQNFRADQNRTFANETAQRQAEFGAASAPLLREQQQFTAEQAAGQENVNRDFAMSGLGTTVANTRARQREQDYREAPGSTGNNFKPPSYRNQLLNQAYDMILSGEHTPETLPQPLYDIYHAAGGGAQRGRDVREITNQFTAKGKGFTGRVAQDFGSLYPGLQEKILSENQGLNKSMLRDTYRQYIKGQKGAKFDKPGYGTGDYLFPDLSEEGLALGAISDSSKFYNDLGNLGGYIEQQSGRQPEPNDGSYSEEEYAEYLRRFNAGEIR